MTAMTAMTASQPDRNLRAGMLAATSPKEETAP
jgi:hypothetical protein